MRLEVWVESVYDPSAEVGVWRLVRKLEPADDVVGMQQHLGHGQRCEALRVGQPVGVVSPGTGWSSTDNSREQAPIPPMRFSRPAGSVLRFGAKVKGR